MKFEPTFIAGLVLVHGEPSIDARGDFTRWWCARAFTEAVHRFAPSQMSVSRNPARHTLRGLHWQVKPHGETKLVRAASGCVHDVAVDMRPDSPTLHQSFAISLSATEPTALLIPPGCAHGFLTLSDNAEITYLIDSGYCPSAARGARYDDPKLAIAWPAPPMVISERDLGWPRI